METAGKPWDVTAIGTAKWTGARLADVIADSLGYTYEGLYEVLRQIELSGGDAKGHFIPSHVHFIAADQLNASIPIKKALDHCKTPALSYVWWMCV